MIIKDYKYSLMIITPLSSLEGKAGQDIIYHKFKGLKFGLKSKMNSIATSYKTFLDAKRLHKFSP